MTPAVGDLRPGGMGALEIWAGEGVGWLPLGERLRGVVVQSHGRYLANVVYDAGPVAGKGREG